TGERRGPPLRGRPPRLRRRARPPDARPRRARPPNRPQAQPAERRRAAARRHRPRAGHRPGHRHRRRAHREPRRAHRRPRPPAARRPPRPAGHHLPHRHPRPADRGARRADPDHRRRVAREPPGAAVTTMRGRNRLYLSYAFRSLRRGGQRSLLAIFCVAVGVMAVVALRLAGDMVSLSLTSNVREVNGGDVSMQSTALPLSRSDLQPLDQLKQQGLVTDWIGLGTSQAATVRKLPGGHSVTVPLYVVDDPSHFPLVGAGELDQPSGATYAQRLKDGTVVVSRFVADEGELAPGDRAHVTVAGGQGTDVTVGGVAPNTRFAGQIAVGYVTRATYTQLVPDAQPR